MNSYPVYIINLKKRIDRKNQILREFMGKPEFTPILIDAIENKNGALGLWITIKNIIKIALNSLDDFIIICEDDHKFTENYNKDTFFSTVREAKELDAEILCGGVSFFSTGFSISKNLIWMEIFSGLQFTIIFKSFYQKVLCADFPNHGSADTVFSVIGDRKFCIFPYISVQTEYGYSDVTSKNNEIGRVGKLFEKSISKGHSVSYLTEYWLKITRNQSIKAKKISSGLITLPCFLINLQAHKKEKAKIKKFLNKAEFSTSIMPCSVGTYLHANISKTIKTIVENAIVDQMAAVIITFNFHEFTKYYKSEYFLENFYEAYIQNCEILAGGTNNFDIAIPVSANRFWMNRLIQPAFLVIYKAAFNNIVESDCEIHEPYYLWLSRISINKMCIYPFISRSDIAIGAYLQTDQDVFSGEEYTRTHERLKNIQEKFNKYCLSEVNPKNRL